jgi:hypothetical protein
MSKAPTMLERRRPGKQYGYDVTAYKCDCGRPGTVWRGSYACCTRCDEIQKALEYRRKREGLKEKMISNTSKFKEPKEEQPLCGGSLIILERMLAAIL